MILCPECGSGKIQRSQRRGIVEGLLLRLALRAPFRCIDCNARFSVGSYQARQSQGPREPHDLLSFLGFHSFLAFCGDRWDKFQRALIMILVAAVAIVATIMLIFRLLT